MYFCPKNRNDKRKESTISTYRTGTEPLQKNRKLSVDKNSKDKLVDKRTILKKEDIKIDFRTCHNCKIKKPTELMVQCKNKDNIRSVKTYNVFNMNLVRSKFFPYFYYNKFTNLLIYNYYKN